MGHDCSKRQCRIKNNGNDFISLELLLFIMLIVLIWMKEKKKLTQNKLETIKKDIFPVNI